ncbi:glutamate decarboxylase [Backusella circina FSU 941]|nr:glutamate decarboxylase [Backusella circina FSU 941]
MKRNEIKSEGDPAKNIGTFSTTFMEEEAIQLILSNAAKNIVESMLHPETIDIIETCVDMVARLFHVPLASPDARVLGCSTAGSSEAVLLTMLSMKKIWQKTRALKGLPTTKPNFVLSSTCSLGWIKAMRHLEVEWRKVECTESSFCMDPQQAVNLIDENTIGICAELGNNYTGEYEDIKRLNDLVDKKCQLYGWSIGIHIDAGRGGFVVPFIRPDIEWDFQLSRVHSISVNGHEYGLVYPSIGWLIWRDERYLSDDIVFNTTYLGRTDRSITVNFSRWTFNAIAQYYVLLRLGKKGFKTIMTQFTKKADDLSGKVLAIGNFKIFSKKGGEGLPIVVFSLNEKRVYDEFDIAAELKKCGWIVSAYNMPLSSGEVKAIRIVIRQDFSDAMLEEFIYDLKSTIQKLDESFKP